jgi:hypothetical protein
LDHYFKPGNEFGTGRPPGSRNKRSTELENRLRNRGDTDPADFLSSIVTSQTEPTELKVAASNYLLPYLYSKRGAMPPPRYVDFQIDVTEFTHVSEGEAALAKIAVLVTQGNLDIQTAQELCGIIKIWIDTQYQKEELQFKLNPPETRDTTIRIEGGLPALPGTNITMPVLNGHAVSEQLLTAPTDVVPPQEAPREFTTTAEINPKTQGPHPLQKPHFAPDEPGMNSTNGCADGAKPGPLPQEPEP